MAANYRRLARHAHEQPVSEGVELHAAARDGNPEEAVAAQQDRDLVLKALERLSEEQRTAFVMHELNGHSVPEMAEALAVPLNTLYSRLRLARVGFAEAVRELAGGAHDH